MSFDSLKFSYGDVYDYDNFNLENYLIYEDDNDCNKFRAINQCINF